VERHKLSSLQGRPNAAVVAICGRLEVELSEMDEKEGGGTAGVVRIEGAGAEPIDSGDV